VTTNLQSVAPHVAELVLPLLQLMEQSNIGISFVTFVDGVGKRMFFNNAAAAMMGYTEAELQAVPLIDSVAPSYRAEIKAMLARAAAGQPIPAMIETALAHRDGSEVPVEVSVVALRSAELTGYVAIARLRSSPSSPAMLESDRTMLIGALASGIAHEINNPLTAMLLNLRSLRKQLSQLGTAPSVRSFTPSVGPHSLTESIGRIIDEISMGTDRIANNVKAIMTLAQIRPAAMLDISNVVVSALRLVGPLLSDRVVITRHLDPVPLVFGEVARVGHAVVSMLLYSAAGFSSQCLAVGPSWSEPATAGERGQLSISLTANDRNVIVAICDDGPTPSPMDVAKVFDPFYQSATRAGGVGVGLAVAQSVAVSMGGNVRLTANSDGGATIEMILPY
jgi:PAS domain S-box-containing protein